MKIELQLTNSELFVQETTVARIVFENAGSRTLFAPHPSVPGEQVRLELTDDRTGKTSVHHSMTRTLKFDPHHLPNDDQPLRVELGPREKSVTELSVLDWTGTLAPGAYRLRAIYETEEDRWESGEVKLEVKQGLPLRTVLTPPSSPMIPSWHTLEARGGDREIDLVLQTWKFQPCAMVLRSVRVGRVSSFRSAAASVMPSKMWDQGHWVAWVDDKKLLSAYVSEGGEVTKPRSSGLPDGETELLGPLFHATALQDPPGEWSAFLVQSRSQRVVALAQEFHANGKPAGEHAVPVASGRFIWGQTVHTAEGDRRAVMAAQHGNEIQLRTVAWKKGQPPSEVGAGLDWSGSFLAGALALGDDGRVHGVSVLLARDKPEDNPAPTVIKWTVTVEGEFEVDDPVIIEWSPGSAMTEAVFAIDRAGAIHGLICDDNDLWHLFDGSSKLASSPIPATGGQPLEIFYPRTGVPLIRFDDGVGRSHFFSPAGPAHPSW